MNRKTLAIGLVSTCLATPASAHNFLPEGGFYDRFIEGVNVILLYPATLLPLLALGIMISLWDKMGMVRVWPVYLAGQFIGIGAATLVGPWIATVLMASGVLVAILAALVPSLNKAAVATTAFVIGVLAVAISLEGHGFFELPLAIHLGIFFGANLTVAAAAALARATFEENQAQWLRILWRIAASWIAAMLILYLAFTFAA